MTWTSDGSARVRIVPVFLRISIGPEFVGNGNHWALANLTIDVPNLTAGGLNAS